MTKERSAAIAAVLALAALGWGVLYRPMVAGDLESAERQMPERGNWPSPPAQLAPPRSFAGAVHSEHDREGQTSKPGEASKPRHPSGGDFTTGAVSVAGHLSATRTACAVAGRKTAAGPSGSGNSESHTGERTPGKLPAPKHASPVFPKSGSSETLRSVIKEELPEATPEQIRIWERHLQGMPPNMARHMLQLRRQVPLHGGARPEPKIFSVPNTRRPNAGGEMPPAAVPERRDMGTGLSAVPAQWRSSLDALRRARDVILNNIANAQTPGFKRVRVVFGDLPPLRISDSGPDGANRALSIGTGVRITMLRRDWSNGAPTPTGRALDLAIEGPGLFVLHDGERHVYTRCGRFTVDRNGRIVLAGTEGRWVLDVSLRLSRGEPFQLLNDGTLISVRWHWYGPRCEFETIPLAVFRNPDALQSLGNGLFAETEASGPPRLLKAGESGAGVLKPGCLESSNVDIPQELAELRKLARQRHTLLQAFAVWNASPGPATEHVREARQPVMPYPERMPRPTRPIPDAGRRFGVPVPRPVGSD